MTARERIELALRNAEATEQANRENGRPTAYDAGRVSGLRDALELLDADRNTPEPREAGR